MVVQEGEPNGLTAFLDGRAVTVVMSKENLRNPEWWAELGHLVPAAFDSAPVGKD